MSMAAALRDTYTHVSHVLEPYKNELDMASVAVTVATVIGWIPHVTAVITFIWSCVRLYETKTVQGLLARRRERRARSKA